MEHLLGRTVKVVKLIDTKYSGKHPNGINEGFVCTGKLMQLVPTMVVLVSESTGFRTPTVQGFEKQNNVFAVKTANSIYKIKEVKG